MCIRDRTIPADIYDTPIEELDLSTRTYNCLKRADITKVGQVLEMDEKALLSVRNLGQKSMEEIRDKLIDLSLIHICTYAPWSPWPGDWY